MGDKSSGWKRELSSAVIAALLSSAVVAAFVKVYFDRQLEEYRSTTQLQLEGYRSTLQLQLEEYRSTRQWNESALVEIVGPAMMHFARTESIAGRYRPSLIPLFRDAELLKDSNESMRTLLLSKGYLLPSSLHASSRCLITHYDIWLQRYYSSLEEFQVERGRQPKISEKFDVEFAANDDPECGGFPVQAPKEFAETFNKLRRDLYGTE